jgi:hypothetical protein
MEDYLDLFLSIFFHILFWVDSAFLQENVLPKKIALSFGT